MHQVRHKQGYGVAFFAACVLVLQSFLTAWTAGAMPAPRPMLDAFGSPLCITSSDHGGTKPANEHSRLPDCCTFGCNSVSPLLAAEPADDIGLLWPLSSADIRFELGETFHLRRPDHDPGSPRAPPFMA